MSVAELRSIHDVLLTDEDIASPRPVGFLVLAFVAMVLAELMVVYVHPGAGLALHAGVLVAFVWRAVIEDGATHDLLAAMAVLPLIRVLALAMPFWLVGQAQHFALVNLPLIVATLVAARYLKYGRLQLGLTLGGLPWQVPVVGVGVLIGYLERLIIQPAAMAPDLTFAAVWWPALSLLLFTGLSEELLFRGVLQTAAVRSMGAFWGIVYVSLMFGALHIGWQSAIDVVFVTLVGAFFGFVVHRTGSILGVTLAHGVANIVLFIVLPNLGS